MSLQTVIKIVGHFDESNEGTIEEFLKRAKFACDSYKITYEECIPMLLRGAAFAVFEHCDSSKWDNIEAALLTAFGISEEDAYGKFIARSLQPGEKPDVVLADLRSLVHSMGIKDQGEANKLLCLQFVRALPQSIAAQVTSLAVGNAGCERLKSLLDNTKRVLASTNSSGPTYGGAAGTNARRWTERDLGKRHKQGTTPRRCFGCNKVGHFIRDCPEKQINGAAGTSNASESGNEQGGSSPQPWVPLTIVRCGCNPSS